MNYQTRLNQHLAAYKAANFASLEPGQFKHRGRVLAYDHILPADQGNLNILPEAKAAVDNVSRRHRVRPHRYFHHLNSSQAFALNLFAPYFEGGAEASGALLRAVGQGGALKDWIPEEVPDRDEGTNLDASWETIDGVRTVCEVKLSERDFGKARLDERHLQKLESTYLPSLRAHLTPALCEAKSFFGSYQILRNIWHMLKVPNSRLIFLMPRANTGLWKLLDRTLDQVAEPVRSCVNALAIEDVLTRLQSDERAPQHWRAYAAKLEAKYVPASMAPSR